VSRILIKNLKPLVILLVSLVGGIPISASASVESGYVDLGDGYEVIRTDFGSVSQPDQTKPDLVFTSTKVVPFKVGQGYGWSMNLRTNKQNIKWREEFTLPVKPSTWGDLTKLQSVSADGRTLITDREVASNNGLIFNFYQIAPGDPKGRYVFRVFVGGALAKTMKFDVK